MPTPTNNAPLVDTVSTSVSAAPAPFQVPMHIQKSPKKEKEVINPILREAAKKVVEQGASPAFIEEIKETLIPTAEQRLSGILDEVELRLNVGTAYKREIIRDKVEEANIATRISKVTKAKAYNDNIREQYKLQNTLEAETAAKDAFEARGGVKDLTELQKGAGDARKLMLATQAKVAYAQKNMGFFEKLLLFPGIVEEANIAEATYNKYNKSIEKMTSGSNAIAATIDDMKVTESKATLAASSRLMLQKAQIDAATFEKEAARTNAQAATLAFDMTDRNTALRLKKYDLIRQAEADEALRAERKLRREALEKSTEFDDTYVSVVREGFKRQGLPFAELEDPVAMKEERLQILTARKTKGEARTVVSEAFDIGARYKQPTSYQTLRSYMRVDPIALTDGKNRSLTFFKEKTDEALIQLQTARKEAGIKGKLDEATLTAAVNNGMKAAWEKAEAEIESDDLNNPNHAPPLSELIKAPALVNRPFIKDVLAPILTGDVLDLSVEKVLELAVENIRTKTHPERPLKFEQVNQTLGMLYKKAAVYNTESQSRIDNAFPLQDTYNAKLKNINSFKFSATKFGGFELTDKDNIVNILDGVERRALLLKMISRIEVGPTTLGPAEFKSIFGGAEDLLLTPLPESPLSIDTEGGAK